MSQLLADDDNIQTIVQRSGDTKGGTNFTPRHQKMALAQVQKTEQQLTAVFQQLGIDLNTQSIDDTATAISASPIRETLIAALGQVTFFSAVANADFAGKIGDLEAAMAHVGRERFELLRKIQPRIRNKTLAVENLLKEDNQWKRLEAVLRKVDPNPWHQRLRTPSVIGVPSEMILVTQEILERLQSSNRKPEISPAMFAMIGVWLTGYELVGKLPAEKGVDEWYSAALVRHPTNFILNNQAGLHYFIKHELRKAEHCFLTAVATQPSSHSATLYACACAKRQGRVRAGIELLKNYYKRDPGNANLCRAIAGELLRLGSTTEVVDMLQLGIKQGGDPKSIREMHAILAGIFLKRGNFPQAKSALQKYVELAEKNDAKRKEISNLLSKWDNIPPEKLLKESEDRINYGPKFFYIADRSQPDVRTGLLTKDDKVYFGSRYEEYKIRLDAKRSYAIQLASSDFDTYLILFDGDGNRRLKQNDDAEHGVTHVSRITFTPKTTGDYVVRATTAKSGKVGAYRLHIWNTPIKKSKGNGSQFVWKRAQSIHYFAGELRMDDPRDEFLYSRGNRHKIHRVPLKKDKIYQVDLRGEFDTFLRVESENGEVLCYNNDRLAQLNRDARLIFQPRNDAVYRLVVASSTVVGLGDYELAVRKCKAVGSHKTMKGNLLKSDITFMDTDGRKYAVQLYANKSYVIQTTSDDFDPILVMSTPNKKGTIFNDDISPGNPRVACIYISPDRNYPSLVSVLRSKLEPLRGNGSFTLTVQAYEPVLLNTKADDKENPKGVPMGGVIAKGRLTTTDSFDNFRQTRLSRRKVHGVQLVGGKTYQFDLFGDFDTFLRIEDASKKHLLYNDYAAFQVKASRLLFTPKKTGDYRLIVTSFTPEFGTYQLMQTEVTKSGKSTVIDYELRTWRNRNVPT